ncbi:MAG: site-specific integrase [Patescibacteria group bacterium]
MNCETFEKYLQQKKLRESTIKGHLQDIERFKKWCTKENISHNNSSYNELLKFIQQTKERGVSKSTINIHLNSIGKYYDYLVTTGERTDNPARELRVKKAGKKVLQNLLKPEELEEIYQTYINKPPWNFRGEKSRQSHERNVVILGMMLLQGVHTGELRKIEKAHINLNKGSIYIPGSGRSNGRILKLNVQQIHPYRII